MDEKEDMNTTVSKSCLYIIDVAVGITYLDLAASDEAECEKKFLTDSKIGRSTKERFRY